MVTARVSWQAQLCALLLAASLIVSCHGRITDAEVSRDDRPIILIATPFGFGADGRIEIHINHFQPWHRTGEGIKDPDLSRIGFFITTSEAEAQLETDLLSGTCALEADNVVKLLTLEDKDANFHYLEALSNIVPGYVGGEYSLFFANCEKDSAVSYNIQVSLYNVKANGEKDYLSIGEDMLPTVYMAMFVMFTVIAALWVALCLHNRANAHRIHWIMLALVAFKALTLLTQAGMYHLIRMTGHPEGWNLAFYVFTFMRGILFFVVVILVGTGWSYMKPLLAEKEKKILMVVIPLQVFAEVAIVILDENTPASRSWFTWRDVLHLVDIICCCAILFPIVWSIKHLREASQTDGKAARNLLRLQMFRQFYVLVVSYIYFTRIVVYLLRSTMPYKYIWFADAAGELATLAFYVTTGIKFRPMAENSYVQLATADDGESGDKAMYPL